MKKTLLLIVLQALLLCGVGLKSYAQLDACTTFNGGPYNQGVTAAGCDGQDLELFGLAVWQEEVYFADVAAGASYTFYLSGCAEDAWGDDPVLITAVLGGTLNADSDGYQGPGTGSITDGTVQGVAQGCEITFTATATGTCYFILSTTTSCGGLNVQIDNGFPHIITNEGVPCDECGNGTCAAGEDYCNCTDDCPCGSLITPVYISQGPNGWLGDDVATADAIFCSYDMSAILGVDGEEGFVYMGIGYFGANCLDGGTLDISTDFGEVVGFDLVGISTIDEASVNFLKLSQDDIDASGGTITITITDPNAPGSNPCEVNFVTNVADFGTPASLVNDLCPTIITDCGNGTCEPGESYCGGCADCSCETLVDAAFLEYDGTQFGGVLTLSEDGVFCSYDLFDIIGTEGEEGNLYVGVGFFGNACMDGATLDVEASTGTLLDFNLTETPTMDEATVYFLSVTQADITASGGIITLTYTDNNAPSGVPCSITQTVDLTSLGNTATLLEDLCPTVVTECGNNTCEQGENFCNCADCDCSSIVSPVFVFFASDGTVSGVDTTPSLDGVSCSDGSDGGDTESLYVAIAFLGSACMTDATMDVASSVGEVYEVTDSGLSQTSSMTENGVYYLRVNQAEINNSGGSSTITFTNPSAGSGGSCSVSLTVNWSAFGVSAATLYQNTCDPDGVENAGGNNPLGLSVSPVPATSAVQINYNTQQASDVVINVFDISGKLLARQVEHANGGTNTFGLNIANYAAGVYFVTLNDGKQTSTVKFVKQ